MLEKNEELFNIIYRYPNFLLHELSKGLPFTGNVRPVTAMTRKNIFFGSSSLLNSKHVRFHHEAVFLRCLNDMLSHLSANGLFCITREWPLNKVLVSLFPVRLSLFCSTLKVDTK